MYRIHLLCTLCALALLICSPALEASVSQIYLFGDSLSDTQGSATGGISDGPLYPYYLAPKLGIQYAPGANYAVASARTSDLAGQISNYEASSTQADPNALYIVWAGGNDILGGGSGAAAADNVIAAVSALASFGATRFLVPNLPDLGYIPLDKTFFGTGFHTVESQIFNSALASHYAGSSMVTLADVFSLHHAILDDPSAYGFTNVRDACAYTAPASCDTYLFYDFLHPTTAAHRLLADEFHAAIVPVAPAIGLFCSGLIGMVGVALRRKDVSELAGCRL